MRHFPCCIFLFVLLSGSSALASSLLSEIARIDDRETTQIYLSFDALPYFAVAIRDKRIDITLEKTRPKASLKYFESDARIVKVLPITNDNQMVISLFFRHKPEKIQTEKLDGEKLLIDIKIGNAPVSTTTLVSRQLSDIKASATASTDETNPLLNSRYATDWTRFFTDYESKISSSPPVRYTLPPFPVIDLLPSAGKTIPDALPQEIMELGRLNAWKEMQPMLLDLLKVEQDPERQKLLALSLGDSLLHGNSIEDATRQLNHLIQTFPDDPVGITSQYLLLLLNAGTQQDFSVGPGLQEIREALGPASPLEPYFVLLEIENAIAAGWYDKAGKLLERRDVAYPASMQNIVEMRRADVFAGLGLPLKAYAAFMLLKDPSVVTTCPHTLQAHCETLYFHRKYKEAGQCYATLIPMVEEKEASGLISFRKVMAERHLDPQRSPLEQLTLIEDAFPLTEAAIRAAIKKTDLRYLADKTWGEDAIRAYRSLAEQTAGRQLVAEARFKEALVNHLIGRNDEALQLLMQFLREFRSGELRPTAQALLIQILPEEIDRLVKSDRFPEALVLARQNKDVFQKNWIDIAILGDLAYSYGQIGLYEHAKDVYLYMMDIVETPQREQYFLPLIQTVAAQGDSGLTANLAGRYLNTYPNGADRIEILILYLEALVSDGKFSEAQALLPEPLPEDDALRTIAATLAFHQQDYPKTLELIALLNRDKRQSSPEIRFMEAESLFRTGKPEAAGTIFQTLQKDELRFEQVLYRLAQIAQAGGKTEEALKFYRQIVEKGKNSLWQRYAAKELEYLEAAERLRRKME